MPGLAVKLIEQWRAIWSKSSGTSATAPFGVVALPPSGSEGGADIRSMGHAQTGSWGIMPNPDMPNTFVAQACANSHSKPLDLTSFSPATYCTVLSSLLPS